MCIRDSFSYEQDWALQVQPHHPDYSYLYQVQQFYRWCYEAGIAVDFIREGEPMERYPLVFAPLQYLDVYKRQPMNSLIRCGL